MKCYYDVLKVEKNATDEDLKKSYRRLALQFHPDKNRNNEEEAKVKFQEVQNAYDVLSDSQERAFYDRNRENILRGQDEVREQEDIINLYQYFTSACFQGYDDKEKGFYTVYRKVFESLASKDMEYMNDYKEVYIPCFGASDTNLDDVGHFYGYWQSYCTSISFSWVDVYDTRQAPNRWVEKKIVRENKKVREKARKEFNEQVRALVAFVRKRDKRCEARKKLLEQKVEENARKQAERQVLLQEERHRRLQESLEQQRENISQYEKQFKAMESQYATEWGLSDDETEEDEEEEQYLLDDDLYCVACEKLFKTEKALFNHEQSRKHQEKHAALVADMTEEEATFKEPNHQHSLDFEEVDGEVSHSDNVSSSCKKKKKKRQKQNKSVDHQVIDFTEKRRLSRRTKQNLESDLGLKSLNLDEVSRPDVDDPNSSEETEIENCASETLKSNCALGSHVNENSVSGNCKEDLDAKSDFDSEKSNKKSKANGNKKNKSQATVVQKLTCVVCSADFPSKNKLFAHLEASGHAVAVTTKSKSKPKKCKS